MLIIDSEKLKRATILTKPSKCLLFSNLIRPNYQKLLSDSYPLEGFCDGIRIAGEEKYYSLQIIDIIKSGQEQPYLSKLNSVWTSFINELTSEQCIQELENIVPVRPSTGL